MPVEDEQFQGIEAVGLDGEEQVEVALGVGEDLVKFLHGAVESVLPLVEQQIGPQDPNLGHVFKAFLLHRQLGGLVELFARLSHQIPVDQQTRIHQPLLDLKIHRFLGLEIAQTLQDQLVQVVLDHRQLPAQGFTLQALDQSPFVVFLHLLDRRKNLEVVLVVCRFSGKNLEIPLLRTAHAFDEVK